MKITTKDIISLLPFDQTFKEKLSKAYESADEDQKYELDRTLWITYDSLYEDLVQKHLDQQLEDVLHGRRELKSDLYQEAQDMAEDEMKISGEKGKSEAEITSLRDKLQSLIQSH